jgi:phosphoglycolate phosphatase
MRNIFFDLDGTLVDSLPGIEYALNSALGQQFFVSTGSLHALIGPPIRSILGTITGATHEQLDKLEAAFRAAYDTVGWRRTAPQEGAGRALETLRLAGLRLFLVTNKPLQATQKILRLLGFDRHFDAVMASNSVVPNFTSKSEMLRCLLDRYALSPAGCLMVGDTEEDVRAAALSGMPAVIMTHGYGDWAPLARPECRVLNDFSELTTLCLENEVHI